MRSRNLKPGFFTNELLVASPPIARLLFAGLWCLADREGRLEDRPLKIKMELFPADNCDIDELLQLLHDVAADLPLHHRLIVRYTVDDKRYIWIVNFRQHQYPHVKESSSTIPCYPGDSTSQAPTLPQTGTNLTPYKHPLNPESPILNPESPIPPPPCTNPGGEGGGSPSAGDGGADAAASGEPVTEVTRITHDGAPTDIRDVPGDRLTYLVRHGKSAKVRIQAAAELHRRDIAAASPPDPPPVAESPPRASRPSMRDDPEGYKRHVEETRRRMGLDREAHEDHGFTGLGSLLGWAGHE